MKTPHVLRGLELLESRRVLDCHGVGDVGACLAGDSDRDGQFDSQDLVLVLQSNKYMTGQAAAWAEGDWNGDGRFDQRDIVSALEAGTYRQGKLLVDLSSLAAKLPANSGPFGPPIVISGEEQLYAVIPNQAARDAIARHVDLSQQQLLLFDWSGSGGDQLIGEARMADGQPNVEFRLQFGLTRDLRPHRGLFAIPRDTVWGINIVDGDFVSADTVSYEFVSDDSQLRVTGGFAGVQDEYRIEGDLVLTRNADGTAAFTQVEAVALGGGLSSLDGSPIDSVLNLTGLLGLQISESTLVFSGFNSSGSSVVRLFVNVSDDSARITGGSVPPCCDFFQFEIDANTREVQVA